MLYFAEPIRNGRVSLDGIRQFIDAFADIRLKDRTPEHVKGFLPRLLSSGELADWHYQ